MSCPTDQDKLRAWLTLLGQAVGLKKTIDKSMTKQFGISLSRFDVLAALERGGKDGLKAGDLTRKLVVSDGNTTQVTDKLVRDGLVVRRKGKDDGRVVVYVLTDQGRTVFKSMARRNKKWIAQAFDGLETHELETLRALLGKIDTGILQKEQL